ncbi:MAG: hypothetical protein IE912_07620 [Brevundimonas diminuta]|nr:hypothetical protein [Brevundimonas diminuta]MBD3818756.1 hypothetical protein [Brevundimonas diminuta]
MVILLLAIIAILLIGAAKIRAAIAQLFLLGVVVFLGAFVLERLASVPWWAWASGGGLILVLAAPWVVKASKAAPAEEAALNRKIDELTQRRIMPQVRQLDD